MEREDVRLARVLVESYPLGARDLLHLVCCQLRDVTDGKTFDRAPAAAF